MNERRAVTFFNRSWFVAAMVPVELPVGLRHANSESCWCDPLLELFESGRKNVIHRQVSWN